MEELGTLFLQKYTTHTVNVTRWAEVRPSPNVIHEAKA